MWLQSRYALEFFSKNGVPFQDMSNDNSRVTNGNWCIVEKFVGKTMVVYLRNGGTADINLAGLGSANPSNSLVSVQWYDPRNGGNLQNGTVTTVLLGSTQSLGNAPNNSGKDWVVYLRCIRGC